MFDSNRMKVPETPLQEWMWKNMDACNISVDELAGNMRVSRKTIQRHYNLGQPIAQHWFVAYCYAFGIEDIYYEIQWHKECVIL